MSHTDAQRDAILTALLDIALNDARSEHVRMATHENLERVKRLERLQARWNTLPCPRCHQECCDPEQTYGICEKCEKIADDARRDETEAAS